MCSSPTSILSVPPNPTVNTSLLVPFISESLPLSGDWCFSDDQDNVGEKQDWFSPGYGDSAWTTVSVPHNWNVIPGYLDNGRIAWYRKPFMVPAEANESHLRLRFEPVFYLVRVWGWRGNFCELAPEYQDHIIAPSLYRSE